MKHAILALSILANIASAAPQLATRGVPYIGPNGEAITVAKRSFWYRGKPYTAPAHAIYVRPLGSRTWEPVWIETQVIHRGPFRITTRRYHYRDQ